MINIREVASCIVDVIVEIKKEKTYNEVVKEVVKRLVENDLYVKLVREPNSLLMPNSKLCGLSYRLSYPYLSSENTTGPINPFDYYCQTPHLYNFSSNNLWDSC